MGDLLLAIDQGTTTTRTIVFDAELRPLTTASRPLTTGHPRPGWVEQDAIEILATVVATVREAVDAVGGPDRIAAVGLDNQGETVVAWDAASGEPLGPAVSWQCKRSAAVVERLVAAGHGPVVRARTGLPLDPYFSAGKMTWLLEEVPGVAHAAAAGRLRLGTLDAWLTDRLCGTPWTDPSTAARTQLYDIGARRWDPELIAIFGVPEAALPAVRDTVSEAVALQHPEWGFALPLHAMACDQQAALAGHGCFLSGDLKATYGTGVFILANAGRSAPHPPDGLLATVAWSLGDRFDYALDGGVFTAGTLVDWLRDGLGVITSPSETETLARSVPDDGGVRVLPALAGLGAPWWRPDVHAQIAGLTRAATRAHVVRAALDGIAHRVADVVERMWEVLPATPRRLRVDGGLAANGYLMQRQADLLGIPVEVAATSESTALGVAGLAALGSGIYRGVEEIAARLAPPRRVTPTISEEDRNSARASWHRFIAAALSSAGALESEVMPPTS